MGQERPTADAQWDEVHRRWERWDEDGQDWVIVGSDLGDGVAPEDENPLPPALTRMVHHADELDALEREHDLEEAGAVAAPGPGGDHRLLPSGPRPDDAQWDEILGRWVYWDPETNAWADGSEADPDV
jgi:hypothetical protein